MGDKQSVLDTAWQYAYRLEDTLNRDDPTVLLGMGDQLFGLPCSRAFTMTLPEMGEQVQCRAYTFGVLVYFPERRVGWPLPYTIVPWDVAVGGR